jgi:thioredoxin 1
MATIQLTSKDFRERIFDYETKKEWDYEGTLPAIVDFYADWCGPCKMVAPILEQLSEEYAGRLIIYKVNTDLEPELSGAFGIRSIPTLLMIDVNGEAGLEPGAFPKHVLKKIIEENLLAPVKAND